MTLWHARDAAEIQSTFIKEARQYGPNQLEDQDEVAWYTMLAGQFKNLLILILVIAAILSFFIGDKIDAFAILIIVVLNALLGFVQEWKAETALKSLKTMLAPSCRVVRNGVEQEIRAQTLVPGDHVLLAAGNAVPADIRLIMVTNLMADEASLTGESLPVSKTIENLPEDTILADRVNMVWMGTHITNGYGEGLVVATGMDTEFGRIAHLTGKITGTQTRLQRHLAILARQLGILALALSAAVVLIGILDGKDIVKMMMTGVSLAVAAVPEGLPAVVTITLALGLSSMARKRVLLRHLQAAETLGAISVICTDKTGTLTKNEMTVQKIWLPGGEFEIDGVGYCPRGEFFSRKQIINPQSDIQLMEFLDTGRKCSHARLEETQDGWKAIGSPTEVALIAAAEKAGLSQNHGGHIIHEFSFNSDRKRMSVIEGTDQDFIVHVKGAPESLLVLCSRVMIDGRITTLRDEIRSKIQKTYDEYSREGLRTLALARKTLSGGSDILEKDAESDLVFLGIAGIIDPPRPEVAAALAKAKSAGIRVIVITGDSPETALAVTRQIGIETHTALTGPEINQMTDAELSAQLQQNILFARTVPEDKFRIVKLLQAQNQMVAMTGDGVNDAPALKQADIGIAMGIRGTDVAKGAADIVLTDDNFASIIAAIEEGRRQYANIRKFIHFLVAHNIGEVSAILLNIIIGGPLLLLPIQILWINLATDGVTALALSVEKAEKTIMSEPPKVADQKLIDRGDMITLGLSGLYIGCTTIALFHLFLEQSYALASTVAFTNIVMTAQILVLNFRSLRGPINAVGWFSNPWLLSAMASMVVLQMIALYFPWLQKILHTMPLQREHWLIIVATMLPLLIVSETYKIIRETKFLKLSSNKKCRDNF